MPGDIGGDLSGERVDRRLPGDLEGEPAERLDLSFLRVGEGLPGLPVGTVTGAGALMCLRAATAGSLRCWERAATAPHRDERMRKKTRLRRKTFDYFGIGKFAQKITAHACESLGATSPGGALALTCTSCTFSYLKTKADFTEVFLCELDAVLYQHRV